MEEYEWGDLWSGNKHTQLLNFDVALRTTTTSTTTSTSTTTTPTTTSQVTEISSEIVEPLSTTVSEYDNYDYSMELSTSQNIPENTVMKDEIKGSEELNENSFENHDYQNFELETQDVNSSSTEGRADTPIYDDEIEFLAIEEAPAEVIIHNFSLTNCIVKQLIAVF